ncbi:MAG: LPXTG cell wall anchor domain-containing protein [Acidimicrobiales bacterium]
MSGLMTPSEARPAAPEVPAQLFSGPIAPYAASADGDLLTLTVAEIPTVLEVADLGLVHSEAVADSRGPVNGDAALRSAARAANLDPLEVLDNLDLSDLLSEVVVDAPPSDSQSKELLTTAGTGLDAIADLSVGNADAVANWAGDNLCVTADQPLSQARNEVATLEVLGNVVSLTPQGAVHIDSKTSLPSIEGPGDARAVQSQSVAQTAGINIAGQLLLEVVGDPTLTATATGLAGGASVEYAAPVLQLNGDPILTAQELEDAIVGPLLGALGPLLDILDPLLSVDVGLNVVTNEVEAPDGTVASADAAVATITVTLLQGVLDLTVLDLAIAPMHAEAVAPAGGLRCPDAVDVEKDGPPSVRPGERFDYTITASNLACPEPLDPVKVIDTISGEVNGQKVAAAPGTTVVSTNPQASSVSGTTVTWDNVGPIALGETKTLTITVQVPADVPDGFVYVDDVSIEAACDGVIHTDTDHIDKPAVEEVLPATGSDIGWLLWVGATGLAVVASLGVLRRRRAVTVG